VPPARAARRVPAPTTPAARVRAPAPAPPARRPSRGEPLSAAGPAVRLTPAKTARPAAVPSIGGGGDPLPGPLRVQLEQSLRVDLRGVRVHTDAHAHELAKGLSARAVTYGNHIFLGAGEQPTDIALVGHEVAHVVQQRAAPRLQAWNRAHTDSYEREAHQTADAVARRQQFTVHERTTGPRVQRLGISDALDYFADKANLIPGFRMFTIILGVNPINMSSVDRSAANILRALIEFIPGGGLVTEALDNYGIFDKVGAWIEQQVAALGMVGSSFRQAVDDFLDSLSWTDIFDLGDVWRRAKRIFTEPIDRLISFAKGVITDILKFIKEAILKPLAALAEGTPAYDLLKAVLGEDPITGDPVAQDADALIGGFMKLIGQEEVYNNIKKANALSRAWAWFQGALSGLLGFVRQIPGLFIAALQSLELFDVVLPPRAFVKIGKVFAGFFGQFVSWAGGQVLSLLQIIFEVVAPGAVPYIKKAAGAFKTIIANPIGFIGNLVKAGKQGFQQFASRFLAHLKKSLIDWLTGTLSGANIYIPQSFDFVELIKFVLSVLGLTWQNIRQKLVKAIGETAVKVLEKGFDIVVTLVTQGPAAAWKQIKDEVTNLKQMAIDAIMDYVKMKVVEEAVKKLVSFLTPVGAFIQAIIAIYNTIMFFVERLKQIARVAMAFIDSIAAIAAGSLGAAANKVEQTMAGFLTLVISFLARFAGLGKVSDAVLKLLAKVRAPIDKALDRVVAWIVSLAKKLGKLIATGAAAAYRRIVDWWRARRTFRAADQTSHSLFFQGQGRAAVLTVATTQAPVNAWLRGIAAAANKSTDPAVRTGYSGALKLAREIEGLRDRVERSDNPRQPADVDELNQKMLQLASFLIVLIPLATPDAASTAPSGGKVPVAVGALIKVASRNLIAVITAVSDRLVNFKYIRPGARRVTAEGRDVPSFIRQFGTEYTEYVDDPRELYMGPTPRKASTVGAQVRSRMEREGKYRPDNGGEVLYGRDLQGKPLPAGHAARWVNLRNCDMGHVIDAVSWWNSNGRLTGPQSPEVLQFMTEPDNYEFEPGAENRLRGARLGAKYLPPVI
jgi:Domain of unknown function (DUF4157)